MATVKTRILIISDTHCAALSDDGNVQLGNRAFRLPLPTADVLIHCGDLTMTGQMDEYHKTLDMLKLINATTKLVIAGNHDLSLDHAFVQSHRNADNDGRQPPISTVEDGRQRWQEARAMWTSVKGHLQSRAQAEGVTFLDEGVHVVNLANGASVKLYASPYTPEFCDWGFAYEKDQDRFNESSQSFEDSRNIAVNPVPGRSLIDRPIDILVSHGPAWKRLDFTGSGDHAGCPHLLHALMRSRPLISCCGHIHEAWGAERVRWAERADDLDFAKMSTSEFRQGRWREGIASNGESVSTLCEVDEVDACRRHSVYKDLSADSDVPIQAGKETVFINAAIMDLSYKPTNTPWLIDIDLPSSV